VWYLILVGNDAAAASRSTEAVAGQEIRGLRIARGWSQQEVAMKMRGFGYSWNQTMVSKIEAGTRPLRVNELADLAQLFAVPVAQLLLPQVSLEEAEKEIAELEPALKAAEARAAEAEAALKAMEELNYELNRIRARLDYLRRRRDSLKPADGGDT
jgi:transcriptional regulator with XRE-family HTH domain